MTKKENTSGCLIGLLGAILLVVYIIWFIIDQSIDFWPAIMCFILMFIGLSFMPKSKASKSNSNSNKNQTIQSTSSDRLEFNVSMEGRDSIVFDLRGVHLEIEQRYILGFCKKGDIVELQFEPDNKYDENAIQVFHNGFVIGYVPMEDTNEIRDFMEKYNYRAFIYYKDFTNCFLTVEIGLMECFVNE